MGFLHAYLYRDARGLGCCVVVRLGIGRFFDAAACVWRRWCTDEGWFDLMIVVVERNGLFELLYGDGFL